MNDTQDPGVAQPARAYPRTLTLASHHVQLERLLPADGAALERFVATLPTHDLLFVRRDLSHPKVQQAWLEAIGAGRIAGLGARSGDELVGCSAIVVDELSWSRHVGELRVLVSPAWRSRGLGRALVQESFMLALGMGLEKLCVQMTVDQRAAIAVFEELGFRAEAVLRGHVKDRDGNVSDLAILSHDIAEVHGRLHLYGVGDMLGG